MFKWSGFPSFNQKTISRVTAGGNKMLAACIANGKKKRGKGTITLNYRNVYNLLQRR